MRADSLLSGLPAEAAVSLDDLCAKKYPGVQAPAGFKVRLVTGVGKVTDATFNQFVFDGMEAAKKCFDIDTDYIETTSQGDYARNLTTALGDQPSVVITVGFLLAADTLAFAEQYPAVSFIGVDQPQPQYPRNYAGVLFREDQAGFLAGAIAGLLTDSGVLGVIGGRGDTPPVVRYVNGFKQGAMHTNKTIAPPRSVFLSSFTDEAAGASAAEQFVREGADVVFGAGGLTGSSSIKAAAKAGAWVIGADQDEYLTTFGWGKTPGSDRLATSVIKRVDLGVFEQLAAAVQGQFKGGAMVYDAAVGGVTYAPFHDAEVPAEHASMLEKVRSGLADGSIDTGIDPTTGLPRHGQAGG